MLQNPDPAAPATMRSETLHWTARGAGFAVGVAIVVTIIWVMTSAAPVLVLVFAATLLASALEPIIAWIRAVVPIGRGPTILIVYLAFLAIVVGLVLIVVPAAYGQIGEIGARLPALLDKVRASVQGIHPDALRVSLLALVDSADEALRPAAPDPGTLVAAGLTVATIGFSIVTLLTIVFFWLTEHARLQRYALSFLPGERRAGAREAWNEIEARLGLWVRGQLTLMAAVGLATGTAYTALGVPAALSLAVFAALAEAIPIVGPLVGAVPAVLVAATISLPLTISVAIVYVVIQFVEANVLVPIVMKNTIGLSPYLVIVSLLIGSEAGGIVGAFLAVPVAASVEVILERLQAREEAVAPNARAQAPQVGDEEVRRLPDAPTSTRVGRAAEKREA